MFSFIGLNTPKATAFIVDGTTITTSNAIPLGDVHVNAKSVTLCTCYSTVHRAFFVSHRTPPSIKIHRNVVIQDGGGKPHHLTCATPEVLVSMTLTPDEEMLIAGGEGGCMYTWHIRSGALLRGFAAHFGPILSLDVSADGRTVISASEDATVKTWSLVDVCSLDHPHDALSTLRSHSIAVSCVLFFPSNPTMCVTSSRDCTLRVFDLVLEKQLWSETLTSPAVRITLSHNESAVYAASQRGEISMVQIYLPNGSALPPPLTLVEIYTGVQTKEPTPIIQYLPTSGQTKQTHPVGLFVPASERLVCVMNDGSAKLWDTASLQIVSSTTMALPLNVGCSFRHSSLSFRPPTTIGHLKKFPLTTQSELSYALPDYETLTQSTSLAQESRKGKQSKRRANRSLKRSKEHHKDEEVICDMTPSPITPAVRHTVPSTPQPTNDDAKLMALRAEAEALRSESAQLARLERELTRRHGSS